MPSSAEIFATAATDIMEKLGASATFTPAVGDPVEDCHISIERDVELQPSGFDTEVYALGITVEALLSEVGGEPNRGDVFETETETFTVEAPISNDGTFVKVQVV